MEVMRTSLYVPANNPVLVEKAPKYPADIITFDVEDAVPPQEKPNARKMAAEALKTAGRNGSKIYVRVNAWPTGWTNDDLEAVVYPGLDGITLPKTSCADDVKRLDWKISELEARRGIPEGTIKVAILLETAEGVMRALECCTASKRVVSVFFGVVDFCTDMRITRTNKGEEQRVGRTLVGMAARAAGIVALDGPFADFSNVEAFKENTLDGRNMGFEGRMIINPRQIEIAHELYSPTQEELDHARAVVKYFEEEGLAKGLASVSMDGKMVDTPVYIQAQNVIKLYDAIQAKEASAK